MNRLATYELAEFETEHAVVLSDDATRGGRIAASRIDISPARRRDVPTLGRLFARAFIDDPVMSWMLPDADTRAMALERRYTSMIRHHYIRSGVVELAGQDSKIGAAALWSAPNSWQHSPLVDLIMRVDLRRALGRRARAAQLFADTMDGVHPDQAHWYLSLIGSDPTLRGAGYGHALIQSRLDFIDSQRQPTYLESTSAQTIPYYERFGFEITGEVTVPYGPTLWQMWRKPR